MESHSSFDIKKIAAWIFVCGGALAIIIYFQTFLKPLVVSVIIWFLVRQLKDFINRSQRFGIKIPTFLVNLISLTIVLGSFYLVMLLIVSNIERFVKDFDLYSENINSVLILVEDLTGYDVHNESTSFRGGQFRTLLTSMAGSISAFVGKFFLVILYVAFIMLESRTTNMKIHKVFSGSGQNQTLSVVINETNNLFKGYVSVKIFTSFLTGCLSFVVMLFLNVQLAGLWAFIIFLLNFIPSVGSLIATSFPAIFMVMQTGSPASFVYVVAGVGSVQLLVGNVLEPKIMGDRLNLSPMVVIMALIFWGFVWGVIGMLLSVPILAMQMIIFSQFKETRSIAVLISRTGDILPLVSRADYKKAKGSLKTSVESEFEEDK
jgi:predicted PurR-regulated permease PerM